MLYLKIQIMHTNQLTIKKESNLNNTVIVISKYL
jgi:hypothetical protein